MGADAVFSVFGGQGLEQTVGREDNHESSGIARTDRAGCFRLVDDKNMDSPVPGQIEWEEWGQE